MKYGESIIKTKKEIKEIEIEVNNISGELGGLFYDSELVLDGSETIKDIVELEKSIPKIKEKLLTFQGYNKSVSEAKDTIANCSLSINESITKLDSVFEKIGVELYCFIGEKELSFSGISGLYSELKEGEEKAEILENKLYKLENSIPNELIFDKLSKPFKIKNIKKDINHHNKASLKRFRALGKFYSETPQLIDEETNESLLDILTEYRSLKKNIKHQEERRHNLELRIQENENKIQEGSNGIKLKSFYNNLEKQIVEIQNNITDKLVALGFEIADSSIKLEDPKVISKLNIFLDKKTEFLKKKDELIVLEKKSTYGKLIKEAEERTGAIAIEEEHIELCQKSLQKNRDDLKSLNKQISSLKSELNSES